ncbi:MAG TPA: SDR family oxidoreductase, partial [Puia sp.]|nr:SDR family oxidoreductase [Puia sp.]
MNKVLLAGATGYLGGFILKELLEKQFDVTIVVRNKKNAPVLPGVKIITGELTDPKTIENCCEGIDVVISTVGITKQKDGFTYMDVDYGANLNLLEESKRSGVNKFVYVSVLRMEELRHLKICEAKEKFVDALTNSGLDYCVVRPNGYFSDMEEFYKMAVKGRVFLFGDGECKINPIHGADLAEICRSAIQATDKEITVGGPEILTYNQIAQIASGVSGNKIKITHIPNWAERSILSLLRNFTGSKL